MKVKFLKGWKGYPVGYVLPLPEKDEETAKSLIQQGIAVDLNAPEPPKAPAKKAEEKKPVVQGPAVTRPDLDTKPKRRRTKK